MLQRAVFILIALFWVTMNVLLWRSEYGDRPAVNSPVPAASVWRKILNAPDDSSLNIFMRGKRAGFCRLQTSVGEELSKIEEAPGKGVKAGNRVRFDGSLALPQAYGRFRFESDLLLKDERHWAEFKLRFLHRPMVIELNATAANQIVRVHADDGDALFDRTFKFTEFQNPISLIESVAGPVAAGMLGGLDADFLTPEAIANRPDMEWEAWNDTLTIGHESVRVYRLQTRVMDRYNIVIFVSRAGEILKAELPDGIVLLHDKLSNF